MIFNAQVESKGEVFFFASLDGEDWLPVTRRAEPGSEDQLQRLFDGDGNFKPLVWTKRYLVQSGAIFFKEES